MGKEDDSRTTRELSALSRLGRFGETASRFGDRLGATIVSSRQFDSTSEHFSRPPFGFRASETDIVRHWFPGSFSWCVFSTAD